MAVDRIEKYRQLNGDDVLKVFTKPTKAFPEGACFYCDASDEELVKSYAWFLYIQKHPYVIVNFRGTQTKRFHREKAYNILGNYPDYINHIDRRKDIDLLDLERTGQISEDEAVYRHVLRYADNAWYIYRYNLFSYFRDNRIPIPAFSTDINGFMCHPVTGHRLCPL